MVMLLFIAAFGRQESALCLLLLLLLFLLLLSLRAVEEEEEADSVITGNLPAASYTQISIRAALVLSEWAQCLAQGRSDMMLLQP